MSNEPKCKACGDTGMSRGSQFIDCGACGAAVERAAIDDFGRELNGWPISDMCWAMYQRGKAVVKAAAVPAGWQVVPCIPNVDMQNAAMRLPVLSPVGDEWDVMLGAAPKAP